MALRRKRVLINAMHASTGGGVTYLKGIVPELARDERFDFTLLATKPLLDGCNCLRMWRLRWRRS